MAEIEAVILAAGLSSRAGSFKPALILGGEPLLIHAIRPFCGICRNVIVVTGFRHELVDEMTAPLKNVTTVFNEDYSKDMFSSVKKGISLLKGDRFFLTPGDYPFLRTETLMKMLALDGDVVIPRSNGRKGHPLLIRSSFVSEILGDNASNSMRDWISRHETRYLDTDDEGILFDIDSQEDYRLALKIIGEEERKTKPA